MPEVGRSRETNDDARTDWLSTDVDPGGGFLPSNRLLFPHPSLRARLASNPGESTLSVGRTALARLNARHFLAHRRISPLADGLLAGTPRRNASDKLWKTVLLYLPQETRVPVRPD